MFDLDVVMHHFGQELEKIAVVGPLVDILNLGIPSGVGYALGRTDEPEDKEEAEAQAKRSYNWGAGLLIPGYTGYHYGKKSRGKEKLRAMKRERRREREHAEILEAARGRKKRKESKEKTSAASCGGKVRMRRRKGQVKTAGKKLETLEALVRRGTPKKVKKLLSTVNVELAYGSSPKEILKALAKEVKA